MYSESFYVLLRLCVITSHSYTRHNIIASIYSC